MIFSTVAIATCLLSPLQTTKEKIVKIDFKKGSKTIVVKGKMKLGGGDAYSLTIAGPMKLKVSLKDSNPSGLVTSWNIAHPNGDTFGEGKGYEKFDGQLPVKGTYIFRIGVNQMASNANSGKYTLTIKKA